MQESIKFEIKNNDPKKDGVKTYTIATLQDMADCVTIENLEGFLTDLQGVLACFLLAKETTKKAIENGDVSDDAKISLTSFEWTDDWK